MVPRPTVFALLAVLVLVVAGVVPAAGVTAGGATGASVAGPAPGPGGPVGRDYALTLNETPARTDVADVGLDVARSVEDQRSKAQVRLDVLKLQARLDSAASDDERFDVLNVRLDVLKAQLSGLDDAEQAALREYNAGRLTTKGYLYRLAFIDARARQLQDVLSLVETRGQQIQAASIGRRVTEVRTDAAVLGGPVQHNVALAYRGEVAAKQVRVETAPDGYVATTVVGGSQLRQAYRYDLRSESGPTNDMRSALDTVYATYPNESSRVSSVNVGGQRDAGVFYVTIDTPTSQVTAYVDNRNLTVFKEEYRTQLAQLQVEPVRDVTERGLSVGLDRGRSSHLLRVDLADAGSGAPVQAAVLVDGEAVGRTGPEGHLWFPEPARPANVSVNAGPNRTVSLYLDNASNAVA